MLQWSYDSKTSSCLKLSFRVDPRFDSLKFISSLFLLLVWPVESSLKCFSRDRCGYTGCEQNGRKGRKVFGCISSVAWQTEDEHNIWVKASSVANWKVKTQTWKRGNSRLRCAPRRCFDRGLLTCPKETSSNQVHGKLFTPCVNFSLNVAREFSSNPIFPHTKHASHFSKPPHFNNNRNSWIKRKRINELVFFNFVWLLLFIAFWFITIGHFYMNSLQNILIF